MSQEAVVHNYIGQDKNAIAEAFGKAATTYDKHAEFQRDVGHRLLDKLPTDLSGLKVLDLGCGTGYFSEQIAKRGAEVVCADLSIGMLKAAEQRCGSSVALYQQADAEQLPFEDGCFDIVFSSLALQWCDDLSSPLKEMKRVTAADGCVIFSTLLDGSLFELEKSWSKIDAHQHVNHFITINQVKIALAQSSCTAHQLDLPTITVWYDTTFELMRDLKGIGANHVSGRSQGLTSRRMLQLVEREYREFKNHQGFLPATYQVCLGVIQL